MLDAGIAREVARMVLPVNIYTSWYLTINLRSLFNFLSLRNKTDKTTVPTFPMWEIQEVANQMEALAATVVPESMKLFNENGRVSP
jgi:thymidylate synthase (FAD)